MNSPSPKRRRDTEDARDYYSDSDNDNQQNQQRTVQLDDPSALSKIMSDRKKDSVKTSCASEDQFWDSQESCDVKKDIFDVKDHGDSTKSNRGDVREREIAINKKRSSFEKHDDFSKEECKRNRHYGDREKHSNYSDEKKMENRSRGTQDDHKNRRGDHYEKYEQRSDKYDHEGKRYERESSSRDNRNTSKHNYTEKNRNDRERESKDTEYSSASKNFEKYSPRGTYENSNSSNTGRSEYESTKKKDQRQQDSSDSSPVLKEKPNYKTSGILSKQMRTTSQGVELKFVVPKEARAPKLKWRLFPFKDNESLAPIILYDRLCYLFGRDRKVVDIPIDHPSCSGQHALIVHRLVEKIDRETGKPYQDIIPYIMDLRSTHGTFLNNIRIDDSRYYQLLEKDKIQFGASTREYILINDQTVKSMGNLLESHKEKNIT